jgi:uncharacterized membrane protein YozB (DUF420 family)
MIQLQDLPLVNATFNSLAFALLIIGYGMIRAGRVVAHKRCMISAFMVSILFLATYLTYRFFGSDKKFTGEGWIRPVYFFVLITHVTLASLVPFLASYTLYLGLRGPVHRHRRIARITFPVWVYVSITGVIVYVMLFRLFPGPASASVASSANGLAFETIGWAVVGSQA